MATLFKRIGGSVLVGLCVLALALAPAAAQGDKDKDKDKEKEKDKEANPFIKLPAATGNGAGGVGAYAPKAGAGFTVPNTGGGAAAPNPYSMLLNNPYGVGSMSSTMSGGGSGYYPGGYGGYGYQMPDPYGGYLKGAADVINAQGQYLKDLQSSYYIREQVRRAQLDNSRALFDDWLYRRANTPTLEDERERVIKEEIRRAKNEPPPTEIWSGATLNNLLLNAQKFNSRRGPAPSINVDEEVLRKINVTSGKNGSNLGVFKNEGNLAWPLAIRELEDAEALRRSLEEYARKAYKEASKGFVDTGTLREMTSLSNQLHNLLLRHVNKVPFSQYSEAKRFLNQLDDGIKAFRQPDVLNYVNGKYNLKGTTVGDVVKHMTENGLVFAPASPGDEAAYRALQLALAAFDTER